MTVPAYLTTVPVMISSSGTSAGGHGVAPAVIELTSRRYRGSVAGVVDTSVRLFGCSKSFILLSVSKLKT